jgi:hypothetical protein
VHYRHLKRELLCRRCRSEDSPFGREKTLFTKPSSTFVEHLQNNTTCTPPHSRVKSSTAFRRYTSGLLSRFVYFRLLSHQPPASHSFIFQLFAAGVAKLYVATHHHDCSLWEEARLGGCLDLFLPRANQNSLPPAPRSTGGRHPPPNIGSVDLTWRTDPLTCASCVVTQPPPDRQPLLHAGTLRRL